MVSKKPTCWQYAGVVAVGVLSDGQVIGPWVEGTGHQGYQGYPAIRLV